MPSLEEHPELEAVLFALDHTETASNSNVRAQSNVATIFRPMQTPVPRQAAAEGHSGNEEPSAALSFLGGLRNHDHTQTESTHVNP